MCWDASGEDPAAWPVLVFNRGEIRFTRYDCGMAEFLTRVLRGEFPSARWGTSGCGDEGRRPSRSSASPAAGLSPPHRITPPGDGYVRCPAAWHVPRRRRRPVAAPAVRRGRSSPAVTPG
ncbi:hypothetical protein H4K36_29825 [Streptomyces sp. DHE7-1]|nr:hypothetical protein [Streptomyces sp. DHE7-1]